MAINSVVNVMLPRLSYYATNQYDKYRDLLIKNIGFVLLFASAGIAVAALNAVPIVRILGGDQYLAAATPLLLILPALLLSSLNTVLSQYLISSGHERQYAIVNFIGLVSSTIYCFILIPLFGAAGAALGYSLCELTMFLFRCWFARCFVHMIVRHVQLWQAPVSAFAAGFLAFFITRPLHLSGPVVYIFVTSLIFTFFYGIGLHILHEKIFSAIEKNIQKYMR